MPCFTLKFERCTSSNFFLVTYHKVIFLLHFSTIFTIRAIAFTRLDPGYCFFSWRKLFYLASCGLPHQRRLKNLTFDSNLHWTVNIWTMFSKNNFRKQNKNNTWNMTFPQHLPFSFYSTPNGDFKTVFTLCETPTKKKCAP